MRTLLVAALAILLVGQTAAQSPIIENFDSYPSGVTTFAGWSNDTTAAIQWQTNTGATTSSSTGPGDDVSGGGVYAYMEASSPAVAGDQAILSISDTITSDQILTFSYHMFGDGMGAIEVVIDNGTPTTLFAKVGQQQPASTVPYEKAFIWLGGYVGQFVEISIIGTRGPTPFSDIAVDELFLGEMPYDVEIIRLLNPNDGCDLGFQPVTFLARNIGSRMIDSVDIVATLDDGPSVSESVAVFAAPSAVFPVSFTSSFDFSLQGARELSIEVLASAGDGNPTNGIDTFEIDNSVYLDDFESYYEGATVFGNAQNINAGRIWEVGTGSISSLSGPSEAASGSNYLFIESSGAISGSSDSAVLRTGCYDLAIGGIADNPHLLFDYHLFGSSIQFLEVNVLTWTDTVNVFTLSGQQQFTSIDPWGLAYIDLSAFLGQFVFFEFIGAFGPDGSGVSFYGDIAIDNIRVIDVRQDVALNNVSVEDCGNAIQIEVENLGADSANQVELVIAVNEAVDTVLWSALLAPGQQATYTYIATGLLDEGLNSIDVIASAGALDSNPGNGQAEQLTVDLVGPGFFEDFETYADSLFDFDFATQSGTIEWQTNSGATPSTFTGPLDDAAGGGSYIFMESSTPALLGDFARIDFCANLTNTTGASMTFAYHMYGESIGQLEIAVDDGSGEIVVDSLVGEQQAAAADPWGRRSVDLSAYDGMIVSVSIIGRIKTIGTSSNADIALDEIRLGVQQDAKLIGLVSPTDGCDLGTQAVTVTAGNAGTDTLTSIAVSLTVDGGSTATETFAVSIAPGESTDFTLAALADLSAIGLHELILNVSAAGDGVPFNGIDTFSVTNVQPIGLPVSDDFNSYTDGTIALTQLMNIDNGEIWEVHTGATGSLGTGPVDDADGGGLYLYIESSGAINGDEAILKSPCIDLSGATNPKLDFDYHMYGSSIGFLSVDISVGGVTTNELLLVGQQDTSNTDPWNHATIDLSSYIGQSIVVCITGQVIADNTLSTFRGDISLDNIEITDTVCGPTSDVTGMSALVTASNVEFSWDLIPGTVGCQLNGGPLGNFGGTRNVLGAGVTGINLPVGLLSAGTYNARVRCACQISPSIIVTGYSDTVVFVIPEPRLGNFSDLAISPNPATDYLNMNFSSTVEVEETIQVIDLLGRVLHTEIIMVNEGANTYQICLDKFDNGAYFLQVGNGENMTVTQFQLFR